MIEATAGVASAEVRPVTGSIIVRYSTDALNGDQIIQRLADWGFVTASPQGPSKAERVSRAAFGNGNSMAAQSIATEVVNRTLEKAVEKLVERSVIMLIACLL